MPLFELVNKLSHQEEQGLYPFQRKTDTKPVTFTVKCSWDVNAETFGGLSDDTKDFVSQWLVKEKRCRMSATQSLKHKWLKMCQPKLPNPKSTSNPSYCYRNMWLRGCERNISMWWLLPTSWTNLQFVPDPQLWAHLGQEVIETVVKCWLKILNHLAFC